MARSVLWAPRVCLALAAPPALKVTWASLAPGGTWVIPECRGCRASRAGWASLVARVAWVMMVTLVAMERRDHPGWPEHMVCLVNRVSKARMETLARPAYTASKARLVRRAPEGPGV